MVQQYASYVYTAVTRYLKHTTKYTRGVRYCESFEVLVQCCMGVLLTAAVQGGGQSKGAPGALLLTAVVYVYEANTLLSQPKPNRLPAQGRQLSSHYSFRIPGKPLHSASVHGTNHKRDRKNLLQCARLSSESLMAPMYKPARCPPTHRVYLLCLVLIVLL